MKSLSSVLLLGLLSSLMLPAQSGQQPARYLALGDSISFGFNPGEQSSPNPEYDGYPELISMLLRRQVANASCVGESSASFLGAGPDLGCAAWKASGQPLHVSYRPRQTQMNYALALLSKNPKKIDFITISLGGNDLGLALADCTTNGQFDPICGAARLPVVLGAYANNLANIYTQIRGTGYKGPIIAVNYYAFNYSPTELFTPALAALNTTMFGVTTAFGGTVADAFLAFKLASLRHGGDACAAGLLSKLPDGKCDTHPSDKGQAILTSMVIAELAKLRLD